MEAYNFVLFFTLFSSIAAFSLMNGLTDFKDNKNLSSVVQNSDNCDTRTCKNTKCNCCPGYGVEPAWSALSNDECKKCNCGKVFNCTFTKGVYGGITKTCSCPTGYSEKSAICKADCKKNPCQNGGSCKVENGDIACVCKSPYTGEFCEKKCNCKDGKCQEISGKIECICYPEFGKYKKDVCKACDCGKGANCTFTPGGLFSSDKKTCICPEGFKEVDSVCVDPDYHNPCKSSPCKNGASCKKDGIKAICICLPGYNGTWCENDVCKLNLCQNNGICKRDTGKPVCLCTDAYIGDKCQIDKCSLITCKNGGKCKILNKNAVCDCLDKYTGDYCQTEKCSLINCQNGGKCEIKNKDAMCTCPENYTGNFCEKDLTSLENSGDHIFISLYLHKNRSLARNSNLDFQFEMKEASNRTLTQILLRLNLDSSVQPKENKCSPIKCQNGGTCYIRNEKAVCVCNDNFTGDFCEIGKCSLIKCTNGGKCLIKDGKAVCMCTERYTGMNCETDKCSLIKCENGGKCLIKDGHAVCMCTERYTGEYCEIDKCSMIKCQNGGKCDIRKGKAVCICNDSYIGDFCEIDKCWLMRCLNGGKCGIRNQKTVCICTENFTGDFCEKRNSFLINGGNFTNTAKDVISSATTTL